MTSTLMKAFVVLLLAVSALGCDPYYHHHRYRGTYGPGYYGGYGSYSAPYDGSYRRPWGERYRHHDHDYDGD